MRNKLFTGVVAGFAILGITLSGANGHFIGLAGHLVLLGMVFLQSVTERKLEGAREANLIMAQEVERAHGAFTRTVRRIADLQAVVVGLERSNKRLETMLVDSQAPVLASIDKLMSEESGVLAKAAFQIRSTKFPPQATTKDAADPAFDIGQWVPPEDNDKRLP